jgi:hypothetical protein
MAELTWVELSKIIVENMLIELKYLVGGLSKSCS